MNYLRSGATLAVLMLTAASVQAAHLGVMGWSVDDVTGSLYSIDGHGLATSIGSVGFADIEGLAYDGANMILYGLDDATNVLVTINTTTGSATVVATASFVSEDPGLAFDPTSGLLIVSNDLSDDTTSFFSIDPTSGAVASIGVSGVESIDGIGFLSGTLYGISGATDTLYSIDLSDGSATAIGSGLGIDVGSEVGLASNGLTLYMVDDGGDNGSAGNLLSIDPVTGLAALPPIALAGLEFESLALKLIPEPSTLLLGGLAAVGFLMRRRRFS